MNVYFMGMDEQTDEDGDSLSTLELHVRSATPEEAIDLWREHYKEEIEDYDGSVPFGDNPLPDGLWLLHPTTVGVLKWHDDEGMRLVTNTRYHAIAEAKQALGVSDEHWG